MEKERKIALLENAPKATIEIKELNENKKFEFYLGKCGDNVSSQYLKNMETEQQINIIELQSSVDRICIWLHLRGKWEYVSEEVLIANRFVCENGRHVTICFRYGRKK